MGPEITVKFQLDHINAIKTMIHLAYKQVGAGAPDFNMAAYGYVILATLEEAVQKHSLAMKEQLESNNEVVQKRSSATNKEKVET